MRCREFTSLDNIKLAFKIIIQMLRSFYRVSIPRCISSMAERIVSRLMPLHYFMHISAARSICDSSTLAFSHLFKPKWDQNACSSHYIWVVIGYSKLPTNSHFIYLNCNSNSSNALTPGIIHHIFQLNFEELSWLVRNVALFYVCIFKPRWFISEVRYQKWSVVLFFTW